MRPNPSRRRKAVLATGAGGVAGLLALAGPMSAAVAQNGGSPVVTTSQTVKVQLDAQGKPGKGYLFTQVEAHGNGRAEVQVPTSTSGLRNLDGFGGANVKDGKASYSFNVSGTAQQRTVANFTKSLPVSVQVDYTLDGKPVAAKDLAGRSGLLGVTYHVKNVSAKPTEITYQDGSGKTVTETVDVVTPYVGQLQLDLPASFDDVRTTDDRADQAGNGRGGNLLAWTMVLFEPIGQVEQTFGFTAQVKDAALPAAHIQLLPVVPSRHPELKFGQDGFESGAKTGRDLTAGATEIDANLLKLQAGASTLLAGLSQLQDGANQLHDGLAAQALPGAQQLSAGLGQARAGAQQLSDGLSDGIPQLVAGAKQLAAGGRQVSGGAQQLSAGLDQLSTAFYNPGEKDLTSGSQDLSAGLSLLAGGLTQLNDASTGLPAAKAGAAALASGVQQILAGVGTQAAGSNSTTVFGAVETLKGGINAKLLPGLAKLHSSVYSATTPGAYQKLQCAAVILDDVVKGTGTRAGTDDTTGCYATGKVPPLAGLNDTTSDYSKTYTAGVQGQLLLSLQSILATGANPDTTLDTTTLLGGLNAVALGISNPGCDLKKPADPLNPCGLLEGLGLVEAGLDQVRGGLQSGSTAKPGLAEGLAQLMTGLDAAIGGVGQLSTGATSANAGAGDLAEGIAQAGDGVEQLKVGAHQLADGAGQLADGLTGQFLPGVQKLTAAQQGASDLAGGLVKLDDGGKQLASGLSDAADGSTQLADGLAQAKAGDQQIVDGAGQLSAQGTKALVAAGQNAAKSYGREFAVMQALNEKGKNAMPYGQLVGATDARAAYDLSIEPVGHVGATNNAARGGIALAVLAAGALLTSSLRRVVR
jgi:putative membrane protein